MVIICVCLSHCLTRSYSTGDVPVMLGGLWSSSVSVYPTVSQGPIVLGMFLSCWRGCGHHLCLSIPLSLRSYCTGDVPVMLEGLWSSSVSVYSTVSWGPIVLGMFLSCWRGCGHHLCLSFPLSHEAFLCHNSWSVFQVFPKLVKYNPCGRISTNELNHDHHSSICAKWPEWDFFLIAATVF